jgi:LacI family transcriptional regulator
VSQSDHALEAPRPRPTMREVAALAGVGLKTVSRVVNGVPTVAPELVERVNRAAALLGYRPNLTASHLRRSDGRTGAIGLLLEDVSNPYSAAIHRAVENVARERGVLVLTGSLDESPVRERELARTLIDRRVDGLLIVPASDDHSYLVSEQQAGLSVVFIDRQPALIAADAVVADNEVGARTAVEHLVSHGHRRIGYLGDNFTIVTAKARFAGYGAALAKADLTVDPDLVRHDLHTVEAAEAAARELLTEHRPTALFASQNLVTVGAIRALVSLSLEQRVALVGFDDFMLADMLRPGITTVAQDPQHMGKLAAELLFQRMSGGGGTPQTHVVGTRLIRRGSGEIRPS